MKYRLIVWLAVPALAGCAAYLFHVRRDWSINDPHLLCPAVVDMGKRELGEVAVAYFTITNAGGRDLRIHSVQSTCSCSGLEKQVEGKLVRLTDVIVRPREHVQLAMRVLVQGSNGSEMRTGVTFRTNDPLNPAFAIEAVVPQIDAGVTTVPSSLVFSQVEGSAESSVFLDVFDNSIERRAVERVESLAPDRLKVEFQPATEVEKEHDRALIGRVKATVNMQTPGELISEIAIYLSGERRAPTRIPVSGRVLSRVTVAPQIIVLPRNSQRGFIFSDEVICSNTTGKPFKVDIDSVPDGLTAEVHEIQDRPGQYRIRIGWNAVAEQAQATDVHRNVRLRAVEDDRETPLEVRVLCLHRKAG